MESINGITETPSPGVRGKLAWALGMILTAVASPSWGSPVNGNFNYFEFGYAQNQFSPVLREQFFVDFSLPSREVTIDRMYGFRIAGSYLLSDNMIAQIAMSRFEEDAGASDSIGFTDLTVAFGGVWGLMPGLDLVAIFSPISKRSTTTCDVMECAGASNDGMGAGIGFRYKPSSWFELSATQQFVDEDSDDGFSTVPARDRDYLELGMLFQTAPNWGVALSVSLFEDMTQTVLSIRYSPQ